MAEGLVDILCSDFHFPSMLGSVVVMMREGMEPSAAVNMVTLNAARHLRRDTDLGSIEVGKKADLVAFSPRDRFAAVTRVWVDGTVRFQTDAGGDVRQPAVGAA
jgi:alpha-D-ribose 1-methylphosphonate 5-triphosphate diphosphatase